MLSGGLFSFRFALSRFLFVPRRFLLPTPAAPPKPSPEGRAYCVWCERWFSKRFSTADAPVHEHSDRFPQTDVPVHEHSDRFPRADAPVHEYSDRLPRADAPVHEHSDRLPQTDAPIHEHSDRLPQADVPVHEHSDRLPQADVPKQKHQVNKPSLRGRVWEGLQGLGGAVGLWGEWIGFTSQSK